MAKRNAELSSDLQTVKVIKIKLKVKAGDSEWKIRQIVQARELICVQSEWKVRKVQAKGWRKEALKCDKVISEK